jgi:hypothetical protein
MDGEFDLLLFAHYAVALDGDFDFFLAVVLFGNEDSGPAIEGLDVLAARDQGELEKDEKVIEW